MLELKGKTIIFTDLHCGLSGNKISRLNICIKVVKELVKSIKENNVSNVIFGGDWFHSRTTLDVNTINVSLKLIQAISKYANLYLICGNHDSFMKNTTDINSLNMFRNTPNVFVIDKPEIAMLNNKRCLLVPWLTNLSAYNDEEFDVMIGHFEISSKYLIQSYIEDNAAKTAVSELEASIIDSDPNLSTSREIRSSTMIGSFVDLVKKDGMIYAGHIHRHKEFIAHGRNFAFVGSPYQQTLGEEGADCGYYILDENNMRNFVKIDSVPKHILIRMSELRDGKFDYKLITGNIIQKIYDIDVSLKDETAINQKINDFKPYEEIMPEYMVSLNESQNNGNDNKNLQMIRKSKVDYLKNYVSNIDQVALDSQSIEREKLFNVLEMYYKKVTENA